MIPKTQYTAIFKALQSAGLKIETRWEDDRLYIGPLVFSATPLTHINTLSPKIGILLGRSQETLRVLLKNKGISYVDTGGNVFLNMPHYQIVIEKRLKKTRSKKHAPTQTDMISPSNLVSPNSLAFVEAILRKNNAELKNYRSVLHFCQTLGLYQPRASQLMKKMKAKTLQDLKNKLQSMPSHFWKYALESPITKRQLTPFYSVAQNYYSLDNKDDSLLRINAMIKKHPLQLARGPSDVARSHGMLVDQTLEMWVAPELNNILKKTFRLIPGQKDGFRRWLIATPTHTFTKEAILSHSSDAHELNILRAIWDLGFGDSRLRESRDALLEGMLRETSS